MAGSTAQAQQSRKERRRGETALKVLVLAGGKSSERDVSLASGAAVCRGLNDADCDVFYLDPGVSSRAIAWNAAELSSRIGATPPDAAEKVVTHGGAELSPVDLSLADLRSVDVVFIALHGGDGENGRLQALLDACGVPYTGSGMLASALAMDKHAAKRIFVAEGIPTPAWRMLEAQEHWTFADISEALGVPMIVKPNAQGSTVGVTKVDSESQWPSALKEAFRWDTRVIVEEFISGRELTVSILGDQVLPVVEIVPKHGIYDYECKYTAGQTEYICPARLTAAQTRMAQEQGLEAFRALGCQGYGRADFRMSDDGRLYCLEVNTLPGMTSLSLVPKAAGTVGIEFPQLLRRICELALKAK